jgi:hypothetical protein
LSFGLLHSSFIRGGAGEASASDGATRFVLNNIAIGAWRVLCSAAGGETVDGN